MPYHPQSQYLFQPAVNTPEMQEAMDSFRTPWLAKHELVEGSQLYHYTTLGGMQGIVKDRALWCGHASSFNDPLEIQYGQKIVADVLNDAMKREDREDVRAFLMRLLGHIQAFDQMFHAFVACFCESGDLLSQWRGYADRGGGYCLGFKFSSVTRITSDLGKLGEGKPPFLRKVIYNEQEQRELVQQYVDGVVEGAKKALKRGVTSQYADNRTYDHDEQNRREAG